MATIDDIDTKAAVRKFLERRTVVDREDESSDSSEEISAILESVAQAFLLNPQAALSFVLRAKNTLQQIIATDLEFVDYMILAIRDIDVPSEPVADTSDLVEAQTALVEVDRSGRVSDDLQSFDRYQRAIDRFLDEQLAKSLKRRRRGEFERTGSEARQDLFRALSAFDSVHSLVIENLELLQKSVADFQSVDLTRLVSSRVVSRVRASLKKVISGFTNQRLSKTAAALELLAGRDSLRSISNSKGIFDPTVDTGVVPTNRDIKISSEVVTAIATGTDADVDLTGVAAPWTFEVVVDPLVAGGTTYSLDIPYTGAEGRHYVMTSEGSSTYNIDIASNVLYVGFDGIAPPPNEEKMVRAVSLPTGGAVTLSAILTALNDGVTGLIDGTAVDIGAGRILIYGSASVTGISIVSTYPGTFDVGGNYVPAVGSVHEVLGFIGGQESSDPNVFTPTLLVDLIKDRVSGATISLVDGAITVESDSTALLSSLSFADTALLFGFSSSYTALPSYLELVEDGLAVDPAELGVFVGSIVRTTDILAAANRNLLSAVTKIEGTRLYFDESVSLPRCAAVDVRVDAPIVRSLRTLLSNLKAFVGTFDNDSRNLQGVLSPILARATLAQVNDALREIQDIQSRLQNLLSLLQTVVVRDDRTSYGAIASKIISSLEERGLDRSLELLMRGQFSLFFSLGSQTASSSSNLLANIEEVGRNDYSQVTAEEDIADLEPTGSTADDDILPGEELSESQEPL